MGPLAAICLTLTHYRRARPLARGRELVSRTYWPLRNRRVEIPKGGGQVRVLGIPAIRDRVVQGALKLILGAAQELNPA